MNKQGDVERRTAVPLDRHKSLKDALHCLHETAHCLEIQGAKSNILERIAQQIEGRAANFTCRANEATGGDTRAAEKAFRWGSDLQQASDPGFYP